MERIKQALERAQAQRDEAPRIAPRALADTSVRSNPGAEPLVYSQTRVLEFDSAEARRNRIVANDITNSATTAYKVLRTQVLQRMRARGWNALAVTSAAQNEGKTLTSINLSIGLAQETNHTVLLADFDFRNPSVLNYFGLQSDYGVVDHLLRDVPLHDVLLNPGVDSLVVLPGTERVGNSSELLSSPRTVELVAELRERYPSRMLVFDLPPLLAADDALAFAPFVDAVLLVVEDGQTDRTALQHAVALLGDTPLVGTVLNKSHDRQSAYYGAYY